MVEEEDWGQDRNIPPGYWRFRYRCTEVHRYRGTSTDVEKYRGTELQRGKERVKIEMYLVDSCPRYFCFTSGVKEELAPRGRSRLKWRNREFQVHVQVKSRHQVEV